MKSILWILNGCGLEGKGITGGPVRFHEISHRLKDRGHHQHLLTTSGGKAMLSALGCSLPMTIVPSSLLIKKEPCRPFRFWSYVITSLLWRIKRNKLPNSDVIVTVSDYFCDIIPALALKNRHGAKWIAWIHHCEADPKTRPGSRLDNEITSRMQKWSFRQIAMQADCAWINDTIAGDEIERRLRELGMPKGRIRRMKNGIDLMAIQNAPEPEHKTIDAVMIGARPNKGLFDIIPIWEKVNELRPGTRLFVMGGMSGEADVKDQAKESGLPITFFKPEAGFLPANQYYAKIKDARILFAPSHEEGWGIAVCEAMAAGLPVVAYDLPAYKKIYYDAYAKIPCFNAEKFASAIVSVLTDTTLYSELKQRGTTTAKQYDWNQIAVEDESAIDSV